MAERLGSITHARDVMHDAIVTGCFWHGLTRQSIDYQSTKYRLPVDEMLPVFWQTEQIYIRSLPSGAKQIPSFTAR